jgi:acyl-homoserine lactone acylase PvdQ
MIEILPAKNPKKTFYLQHGFKPLTRRIFDFADPDHSFGINPTGQCGYFFDPHFDDQASMYMSGKYRTQTIFQ